MPQRNGSTLGLAAVPTPHARPGDERRQLAIGFGGERRDPAARPARPGRAARATPAASEPRYRVVCACALDAPARTR